MNLIAAVDNKWAIGKNGNLLVSIPEDMKLFREETIGKIVVMGRKTFESLPEKRALHNRVNIVLTSDLSYEKKDVTVLHSLEEALEKLKEYKSEDVYIIGGASVYEQFLPYCDTAHITKVDYTYDADTYFPNLDKDENWMISDCSEEHTYFDICYEFVKYVRK